MSLLDDLQSIDLSGIEAARSSIRAAVDAPEVRALIESGAAQAALGGLGASLGGIQSIDSPEALLRPLLEVIERLAREIAPDPDTVSRYVSAIKEGVALVAGMVEGFSGDPRSWKLPSGISVPAILDRVTEAASRYAGISLDGVRGIQQLFSAVDKGVPTDPRAFADLAIDALLPFGGGTLRRLRDGLTAVLGVTVDLALPSQRTEGLLLALDAITLAAQSGDAAGVRAGLARLTTVRDHAIRTVSADLIAIEGRIGAIKIDALLQPLIAAEAALRTTEVGILEFMERLRGFLVDARKEVEKFDPTKMTALLDGLIARIEAEAKRRIEDPIDAEVRRADAFLRGLLRHLPLRSIRAKVTDALHKAAKAIADADLDRFARAALALLDQVREAIRPESVVAAVKAALAELQAVIDAALEPLIDALTAIASAINGVAVQAEGVLKRALDALKAFRVSIDTATAAIEGLGIEAAGDEVVHTLEALRAKAEAILGVAPLPDSMRPMVEQMIETLQDVDLDATISDRVDEVLAQLEIPASVADGVTQALAAVDDAIQNLIPAEVIASIETEVQHALDVIRGFNPASLLPDVRQFLEKAAAHVESLDPRPAVASIRAPFVALLKLIDALDPAVLLQPAVEVYSKIMGAVKLPDPQTAIRGLHDLLGSAGEAVAKVAGAPAARILSGDTGGGGNGNTGGGTGGTGGGGTGGGVGSGGGGGSGTGNTAPVDTGPPVLEKVRPGDAIRVLGYIPNKLREALKSVEAGPAGAILREVDALTGGLARDLRRVREVMWSVHDQLEDALDTLLRPLAAAQLRAQFAVQGNLQLRTGPAALDVNVTVDAIALINPGRLRLSLAPAFQQARGRARSLAGQGGVLSSALDRAANALERCQLSRITHSLEAVIDALDPEPIALELDALAQAALLKAPTLVTAMEGAFQRSLARIMDLQKRMNPMVQAMKFLNLLDAIREELSILDPARLIAELGEVHAAVRAVVVAYDPAVFAERVRLVIVELAASIRALDPATLLGDLSPFDDLVARIEAVSPAKALAGVGTELAAVGAELREVDVHALLEVVNELPAQVSAQFREVVDSVKRELLALLESLRFASGGASVSVEGSIG